jgi:hypothetical protein
MNDTKEILMRLEDLIFINSVVATELIRITENTVGLLHGKEFLDSSSCKPEHNLLNEKIMEILGKYHSDKDYYSALEKHVIKHMQ